MASSVLVSESTNTAVEIECFRGTCQHPHNTTSSPSPYCLHVKSMFLRGIANGDNWVSLLDNQKLVGDLFSVPSVVQDPTAVENMISTREIVQLLGLCNSVHASEEQVATDDNTLYCLGCELLMYAIGARTDDHTCMLLIGDQQRTAANDGWLTCRIEVAAGDDIRQHEINHKRAVSVASALFCMAVRNQPHRALEYVSYILGRYSVLHPCLLPDNDDDNCINYKPIMATLKHYFTGDNYLLSLIERMKAFLAPWAADTNARIEKVHETNTVIPQMMADIAACHGDENVFHYENYIDRIRRLSVCSCGISWVHFDMIKGASRKKAYICVASALGLPACELPLLPV
jgi:hypothetical protein